MLRCFLPGESHQRFFRSACRRVWALHERQIHPVYVTSSWCDGVRGKMLQWLRHCCWRLRCSMLCTVLGSEVDVPKHVHPVRVEAQTTTDPAANWRTDDRNGWFSRNLCISFFFSYVDVSNWRLVIRNLCARKLPDAWSAFLSKSEGKGHPFNQTRSSRMKTMLLNSFLHHFFRKRSVRCPHCRQKRIQ